MSNRSTAAEILFSGNDMVVEVRELANEVTGEPINDATVSCTLKDASGATVAGQSWPTTLAYVAESDGVYRSSLAYTISLSANARYSLHIDIDGGAGLRGHWEVPCLCRTRT